MATSGCLAAGNGAAAAGILRLPSLACLAIMAAATAAVASSERRFLLTGTPASAADAADGCAAIRLVAEEEALRGRRTLAAVGCG